MPKNSPVECRHLPHDPIFVFNIKLPCSEAFLDKIYWRWIEAGYSLYISW